MIDSKTERERNEVSPHVDKFQGMGTNVQANAFLPECRSVIDLTGSTSNGMRSVSYHNGYSGHDIEKVRRTIIEHESIFRHQLQDLHRLYGRQRELMSEIKKYVSKDKCTPFVPPPQDTRSLRAFEPRFFTSGILPKATDHKDGFLSDNNQVSCDGDTKLSLSVVRTSHQRISDAFYPNPKDRISDNLTLSREMKDFFQNSLDGMNGKSYPSILGSRNETSGKETTKEPSHCPYTDTKVSWKKRKIFGVEISGDEYTFGTASNSSTPGQSNHHIVSINKPSSWVSSSCMKKNHDLKPIEFQSNHKHPQNGLPWFLKNLQVSSDSSKTKEKSSYFMNLDSLQNHSENFFRKAEGKFQNLEQKKEIAIEDDSGRKVEMNETNRVEAKDNLVLHEGSNNECTPNLSRPRIDLNLSLDDDEPPSPIETKASYKECDKIAANAIIDISSSSSTKRGEGSYDLLKWLADIISDEVEEAVPDGMDDFEFTTLRLEDMKEEHHYRENVVFKTPTSDTTLAMKRSRRGRQHRRDFQRDILPGLVTLSRLEVTEDFQTFQELMKAKWGPGRNGRGRKRLERSLTGWGRRRKRCGNAVKC